MSIGIVYMVLAAFIQAAVSALIKGNVYTTPISVQVASYYLIPLVCFCPLFLKNGLSLYKSKKVWIHFVRGFFSIAAVYCFFYSVKYIPLGIATTLFNMIPFFVPLIAYPLLKEKISFKTYLGLSVALCGILLIINPKFLSFALTHFIVGLSSAVLMATAMVLLRYLVREKESVNQIVFNQYASCSGIALLFIGIEVFINPLSVEYAKTHMNAQMILSLCSLGLLSMATQYCFSKAAQYMTASQFAPFLYLSVPLSSMLGLIIWSQNLSLTMILGACLIFAGLCICSFWKEKYTQPN